MYPFWIFFPLQRKFWTQWLHYFEAPYFYILLYWDSKYNSGYFFLICVSSVYAMCLLNCFSFFFDHCGRLCCLKYTSTCIRYLIIGVMHWHPLIIVSDPREDVLTWIRFKNKNGVIESYIINKNNKNKPKKNEKTNFLSCLCDVVLHYLKNTFKRSQI